MGLLLMSLLIGGGLSAQKLDTDRLSVMKARNIGPAGMSGRITAIDAVVADPNIIYAGAASGGVWKTTSGGVKWEPIFDANETINIGAIAIQQNNPDVVWVGTGEGNPRNSLNNGEGIYKSLDGGKTWKLMGLEKTSNIHRIIVHRDNPDIVYVAAIGNPWSEHPERGVYRTKDGGKTWEKILYTNDLSGAADMVVDPSNPNKLFVAMWEHKRWPWFFKSGGEGSGLYVTLDGGDTWTKKTDADGLPKGEIGRIGLAVAPSNPDRVYALVESTKNALYRSDDGGVKWTVVNDDNGIANRPFYYADIFVDSKDPNRIYNIFSMVSMSEDGGKTFNTIIPYSGVHPDHHAWWIHPENPNLIIEGNDGGLNISYDRAKTWRFVENIPVAQLYHVNVDNEFPYNVYGGMQDNGSWRGPGYVLRAGGIINAYWDELMFGDGFDVVPDPENARYGYAMSQGGNVGRFDYETGNTKTIKPTHPDIDVRLRFNWNAAIAQNPHDPKSIYYGSQYLHKSNDKGTTWEVISPDLSTNDPEKQKQYMSGGLTIDATGAENHCTIIAIAPSPLDQQVIWVGTDDGQVQVTRDGGKTWTNTSGKITGMPKGSWVPQIQASRFTAGEALVVVNDYRRGNMEPMVFRTKDFGNTWERIVTSSQVKGYALSVLQDLEEPNLLFLGTENGLWVSIDAGKNWTAWKHGFPPVSTMDMTIQPREHDLVIATFGRSFFVLDDIRPLREIAKTGGKALDNILTVYQANPAYMIQGYKQAAGMRFGADGTYSGENKNLRGATIRYSVNPPKATEAATSATSAKGKKATPAAPAAPKATVKYDTLYTHIFDASGKNIRTLKTVPKEAGLAEVNWGLDERSTSTSARGGRGGEPGGNSVMPGTYKAVMMYGDQKDSTMIQVMLDPRVEYGAEVIKAKNELYDRLAKSTETLADINTQIREAQEMITKVNTLTKDLKTDEAKALAKAAKEIEKELTELNESINGARRGGGQGLVRAPELTVGNKVGEARRYIGSMQQATPTQTELTLIEHAEQMVADAKAKVDAFFADKWPAFKSQAAKADFNPFKD